MLNWPRALEEELDASVQRDRLVLPKLEAVVRDVSSW
jgi:hypothetical protein